jgi:hypothetical protein
MADKHRGDHDGRLGEVCGHRSTLLDWPLTRDVKRVEDSRNGLVVLRCSRVRGGNHQECDYVGLLEGHDGDASRDDWHFAFDVRRGNVESDAAVRWPHLLLGHDHPLCPNVPRGLLVNLFDGPLHHRFQHCVPIRTRLKLVLGDGIETLLLTSCLTIE